jgi:hypothetical protein
MVLVSADFLQPINLPLVLRPFYLLFATHQFESGVGVIKWFISSLQNPPWGTYCSAKKFLRSVQIFGVSQGWQIFLGRNLPKRENISNDHKLNQNLPNVRKIFQTVIKYATIIHSNALQSYPDWGFGMKINHLATRV